MDVFSSSDQFFFSPHPIPTQPPHLSNLAIPHTTTQHSAALDGDGDGRRGGGVITPIHQLFPCIPGRCTAKLRHMPRHSAHIISPNHLTPTPYLGRRHRCEYAKSDLGRKSSRADGPLAGGMMQPALQQTYHTTPSSTLFISGGSSATSLTLLSWMKVLFSRRRKTPQNVWHIIFHRNFDLHSKMALLFQDIPQS